MVLIIRPRNNTQYQRENLSMDPMPCRLVQQKEGGLRQGVGWQLDGAHT